MPIIKDSIVYQFWVTSLTEYNFIEAKALVL